MLSNQPVLRRGAAGISAFLALIYAGSAAAGIFSTDKMLGDFNVDRDNDRIIYSHPSLDRVELRTSATDNRLTVVAVKRGEPEDAEPSRGWGGSKLRLSTDRGAGWPKSYVQTFGVLQEFDSVGDGVKVTLEAMESDGENPTHPNGHPMGLGFLLAGPGTDAHTTRLRKYGLYGHPHGVREEEWAARMQTGASSIVNMESDPTTQVAGAPSSGEMPAPATSVLLLAGLLGWRAVRGRR
jgi:hypothetical protein